MCTIIHWRIRLSKTTLIYIYIVHIRIIWGNITWKSWAIHYHASLSEVYTQLFAQHFQPIEMLLSSRVHHTCDLTSQNYVNQMWHSPPSFKKKCLWNTTFLVFIKSNQSISIFKFQIFIINEHSFSYIQLLDIESIRKNL